MLSPTAPSPSSASDDERAFTPVCNAKLICIDPARIGEFWPYARELIRQALLRADLDAFAPLEAALLGGGSHILLWIAWDGTRIAAAAVTELQLTMRRKVCVILACGGRDMPRWLPLIAGIEKYALAESCAAVRIIGRKGWARVLPQYREHRVILERKL
jgi:hypothetical protein